MVGDVGHSQRIGASAVKVVWTKEAIRDLVQARTYVEQDNPEAAVELARRITTAVAKLVQNPELGRKGRLVGTRELVISKTPYFVPYRVHKGRIELLRVYHGARLYPPAG